MIRKTINKIKEIIFKVKRTLYYYLFKYLFHKPKIMSKEETINRIINNHISVSRFGDGEYSLILGEKSIGFQSGDLNLATELENVFNIRDDRLLVCAFPFCEEKRLNNIFGNTIKSYIYKSWKKIKKLFDYNYNYGNAFISRFYHPHINYSDKDYNYLIFQYVPLLKKIWDNRRVLIVEGEETKLGVGNDLLSNASSIRRIICPANDAYSKIHDIYNAISTHADKNDLVLMALGPTATVLSGKLTIEKDLQCIDIGHVDVVYLWLLNREHKKVKYKGKSMNEVKDTNDVNLAYDEDLYLSQIIDVIK